MDILKGNKRERLEKDRELKKLRDSKKFEKGDLKAMIIAALTTILPFALIVFVLLYLIPALLLNFI